MQGTSSSTYFDISTSGFTGYALIDDEKNFGDDKNFGACDFTNRQQDQDSKLYLEDVNFNLANSVSKYLLGDKTESIIREFYLRSTELLSEAYATAKMTIKHESPLPEDLLFFCGSKFDPKSTLKKLPIEIIYQILQFKNAAFLDFDSFKRERNSDFFKDFGLSHKTITISDI